MTLKRGLLGYISTPETEISEGHKLCETTLLLKKIDGACGVMCAKQDTASSVSSVAVSMKYHFWWWEKAATMVGLW
jgi:hypothetical protein